MQSLDLSLRIRRRTSCSPRHPRYDGGRLFRELRDANIYVRHWDDEKIGQYLRITVGTDEEMDTLLDFLRKQLS